MTEWMFTALLLLGLFICLLAAAFRQIEKRFESLEARVKTLEQRERSAAGLIGRITEILELHSEALDHLSALDGKKDRALEFVRQVARLTPCSIDSSDDALEDAMATMNRLIEEAGKLIKEPEKGRHQ